MKCVFRPSGTRDGEVASHEEEFWRFRLALAAAVSVSACETPQQQNALVGGALGAGTGALIGSAVSGGSAGGALAGAAIGAGSGALIGSAATPWPGYYGGPTRRATTEGRRPADAPSGRMITTATGSAPLSIEPTGKHEENSRSCAGPGRRGVVSGCQTQQPADRHPCWRRDRRGNWGADRVGGFRRQRGRRHRRRPDWRGDRRAGRQRRDGAFGALRAMGL